MPVGEVTAAPSFSAAAWLSLEVSRSLAYGCGMEFEWDETKDRACFERRGFDFAYAVRTFLDPRRIVGRDRRRDYGEDQFRLLGTVKGRAYVVVYTTRGAAVLIISDRKANRREIEDYEHHVRQD